MFTKIVFAFTVRTDIIPASKGLITDSVTAMHIVSFARAAFPRAGTVHLVTGNIASYSQQAD